MTKWLIFPILFQNTYTNADKLLAAAEELAHTGECDPDEIYSVAHELEAHVTSFAARVEQRRRRLELAVLFYTHEKELSNWVDELRQDLQVSIRRNVIVLFWNLIFLILPIENVYITLQLEN